MKLLLDANVILDRALKRSRHPEVEQLFSLVVGDQLFISRFSLHSVAWYITPRNRDGFRTLLHDLVDAGVNIIDLSMSELNFVVDAMEAHHLDFDDAFNLVVAERFDLTIVSSDADFDKTPRGRLSPAQAVIQLQQNR